MQMQERKVNSYILRILLNSNVIDHDDLEIYEYGLEIFKLYMYTFSIILVISWLANTYIETLLFFLNFLMIRVYSGGLHLSSKYLCLTTSVFIFLAFPLIFKFYIFTYSIFDLPVIILMFGIINKYCPVPSQNKLLNNTQSKLFRKKNYIALFIMGIELVLCVYLKQYVFNNLILGSLLINIVNIMLGHYFN